MRCPDHLTLGVGGGGEEATVWDGPGGDIYYGILNWFEFVLLFYNFSPYIEDSPFWV